MEKEGIFQDKTPDERYDMLEATADKRELFTYERQFSNQEIDLFRERLGDLMIDIDKIDTEKAKVTKDFNEKLKPLKKELKELVDNIRFRGHMIEDIVYKYIDHDLNKVNYYTKEGILVNTRPLKFDEQQRSIMSEIRDQEDQEEILNQTGAQDYEDAEAEEMLEEQEDWSKLDQ